MPTTNKRPPKKRTLRSVVTNDAFSWMLNWIAHVNQESGYR